MNAEAIFFFFCHKAPHNYNIFPSQQQYAWPIIPAHVFISKWLHFLFYSLRCPHSVRQISICLGPLGYQICILVAQNFPSSSISSTIIMVQRRAVRWVKRDYSPLSSVTVMQDDPGWRTLEHRRFDFRLIMFFKIYHNIVAINLPAYINKPDRLTRHMHPLTLRQIQVSLDYHKWSFFPHSITMWNSLPDNIATLPETKLDQFKRAMGNIQY